MAKKPETAAEWRAHAEEMHNIGLTCLDATRGRGEVSTEIVVSSMAEAQTYFQAAQSATAMAAYVFTVDSAP